MRIPRRILLGVTGGIAAYKTPLLVRGLIKAGAEVQVVFTPAAHDFITPLTMATLSKRPVLTELFARDGSGQWTDHVHLARWADAMVIAPASANTMGKMAHGLCDNLLLATFLSAVCPVYVAPAMDLEMWNSAATAQNLSRLMERGVRCIGPEHGALASGLEGEGRMTEPMDIVATLARDLVKDNYLNGKRVLVTAGGTQEAIDPVRYITNRSTGKMGYAIALEAARRGALVDLVATPGPLHMDAPGITLTRVVSAQDMAAACKHLAPQQDLLIMAAAVADYAVAQPSAGKMKKKAEGMSLALVPTEDILAWMGANRRAGQVVVGFALETDHGLDSAQEKLARKGADVMVLNSLLDSGAGFGHDTNRVTLLGKDKEPLGLPLMDKADVARHILDHLAPLF
jgi:phosphopantothenoylcysteine decarboxylase / phosphopantothenate---cysteine ligase